MNSVWLGGEKRKTVLADDGLLLDELGSSTGSFHPMSQNVQKWLGKSPEHAPAVSGKAVHWVGNELGKRELHIQSAENTTDCPYIHFLWIAMLRRARMGCCEEKSTVLYGLDRTMDVAGRSTEARREMAAGT